MLKDDFFKILKEQYGEGSRIFLLEINKGHSIFEGHFKGAPIVPGACLVQMAIEVFNFAIQKEYQLKKVKNIKFLNIVQPVENALLEMEIRCKETENQAGKGISVIIRHDETCYGKMDLELME